MSSAEQIYIDQHLDEDLCRGSVSKWGNENLQHNQVLAVEEIMQDNFDEVAKELIVERLSPTPFKERGMYL